ncbi:MAG: hypothetical protein ISR96_13230, partial [Nitrospira sp.]|nr:hypothetical protein [Nitrospira sp.]
VSGGDGIAIKLADNAVTDDNNFVTFYGGDNRIAGRIEGYEHKADVVVSFLDDLQSAVGELFSDPLSLIDLDTGITYNSDWFDAGGIPTITASEGSWPSIDICSLSSESTVCSWLGEVCVLGACVSLGDFCESVTSWVYWPCGISGGSWPSLDITGGSLPSIDKEPFTFDTPSLSINTDGLETKFINFMSTVYEKGLDPLLDVVFDSFGAEQEKKGEEKKRFFYVDPVQLAVLPARIQVQSIANDNGVTYGSKGADYAEWLPKLDPTEELPHGSVVGVFAGKISLETEGADQIMAVSSNPIVLGNMPLEGKEAGYAKTGFLGQIPVFVRGRVDLGDFIIPSGYEDGTGIAVRPEEITLAQMSNVLGRAWSESERRGISVINVSVGLDRNSWTGAADVLDGQITELGENNAEIRAQFDQVLSENRQLKERLAAMGSRHENIENIILALSSDLPKDMCVAMPTRSALKGK